MQTPTLIHHLFEDAADRTPQAIALISGESRSSFAELDARAEAVAEAILAAQGLQAGAALPPNTMIGLAVGRSIDATAGALGILKAGGAWVPLDPSYPESRLQFMLEDTAAPVVLTTRPLLERLSFLTEASSVALCLDEMRPARRAHPSRQRSIRSAGVCHLHIRFDGPAKGCARAASGHAQPI